MQNESQELAAQYDAAYFEHGLGEPYRRGDGHWETFFGRVADFIVAEYAPRTVLDAGCAIGFLVEALRDRGVDARGFDISDYAISQVPEQLKPYCTLGSVTDEIEGTYDLITCIEVLEHLPPADAERALDNLSRRTDRILFSSSPDDDREPTHVNLKPLEAWVGAFAGRGFLPRAGSEALAVSPQAIVFERRETPTVEDLADYEGIRYRFVRDLEQAQAARAVAEEQRDRADVRVTGLETRLLAAEGSARALERRANVAEVAAAELGESLAELRATTWWRVGSPIRGAITFVRVRRRPVVAGHADPRASVIRLVKPFVPIRLRRVLRERFSAVVSEVAASAAPMAVDEVSAQRLPMLRPLSIFPVPGDGKRYVTVITDSLSAGSLFGGVGTSMIMAAMLARRLDASLRVLTRTQPPDAGNFATLLGAHEVEWDQDLQFEYAPLHGSGAVPYRQGEIFLTTSWWSTWGALRSVDPKRIVYLLQEDERMFYPAGDEQLACGEVLADERIRFVVNSAMLHDHLVGDGFENLRAKGIAFEPAFPDSIYFHQSGGRGERKRFFFYARPDNPRNLFLRGLDALTEAIGRGILKADEWEVHFVGSRIPAVTLPAGVTPVISENLPWPEYAALIRSVDVGLSLMATPHPSYPPLDLAACGAVAVTNRFGAKQSLDQYSRNIILAEVSRDALVQAIAQAVELAADEPRRLRNYREQGLSRSWNASFGPAVDQLSRVL